MVSPLPRRIKLIILFVISHLTYFVWVFQLLFRALRHVWCRGGLQEMSAATPCKTQKNALPKPKKPSQFSLNLDIRPRWRKYPNHPPKVELYQLQPPLWHYYSKKSSLRWTTSMTRSSFFSMRWCSHLDSVLLVSEKREIKLVRLVRVFYTRESTTTGGQKLQEMLVLSHVLDELCPKHYLL